MKMVKTKTMFEIIQDYPADEDNPITVLRRRIKNGMFIGKPENVGNFSSRSSAEIFIKRQKKR
jgi:hypothetical protein